MIYLIGLIGAFSNWVRGGNPWRYAKRWAKEKNITWEPPWKILNLLICAATFCLWFGWKQGAFITLGMAIGQALGWGAELRYIVGADKELERRGTWGKWVTFRLFGSLGAKRASWASMVARGAFWGLCLGIPALSFYPLIAGALFPVFYWLAFKVFSERNAWGMAEIGFGFLLWLSVVI